jgi:predicted ATPase
VAIALEDRVRLLLLDNCEHVLDAAADLVDAILAQSTTVKILATSRESLGIADEQTWRVRSLDVDTAVHLFVERAGTVTQGLPTDESDAITEICQRLDGIPLAVELAASRMASMTAGEVRDRLHHRFRLLVGSRRGLERHQTLKHAVQWSYDLLDEPEKALLERCSVFAGGFYLESVCAIAGSDDEYGVLDLLDALVRKSLITADRSSGRTRYSMLETIRQFAEEQLVRSGASFESRTAHAHYFAAREGEIGDQWDSPRQRHAYDWFATELSNLRTAFRWSADQNDLDAAAAIATFAGRIGTLAENLEPVTWAEELVEPARAVGHPRLVSLCAIASLCYMFGRVDDALGYSAFGQAVLDRGSSGQQFEFEMLWLGAVYSATADSERYVDFFLGQMALDLAYVDIAWACVVTALTWANREAEALRVAAGLVESAEATQNPFTLSFALMAYGMALSVEDPLRALEALRRGLALAQESGNRANESYLAMTLAMTMHRVDRESADPLDELDNITLVVRNYYDSGNITQLRAVLGIFTTFLDRRSDHEPAAVIAGFASVSPTAAPSVYEFGASITHLREVLGDQTYALLANRGEEMTMAGMVAYAYDQIDKARAELEQLP